MQPNKIRLMVMTALMLWGGASLAFDSSYVPPYQIPTFDGKNSDHLTQIASIKAAKNVDGDAIFQMVVNCFPERIKWGLELNAVAGLRSSSKGVSTFDESGLAGHYIGIVAKMPLYSATELTAERTKEYQRRGEVAAQVAALLKGLSDRRRTERELGLYTSLEARSRARVAAGIIEVNEQVGYLEKVATSQSTLDSARATIEGARLSLIGQCRDQIVDHVNNYILEAVQ
ncbi:conserved exported hypothetical protein [Crenothrix polyspora]|uniref:Outer membrane efflux protein n=1 Tax=Crenothrix polyspora TaxID=360316 RepID=A0A1R4HBY3_9GAMM|nr:hypothetical protein [Crenothrix polyspora]SJM93390.1 conserved exported hypothetical protein [Crenothrix polyspora]